MIVSSANVRLSRLAILFFGQTKCFLVDDLRVQSEYELRLLVA
jgi:hypothetical protein